MTCPIAVVYLESQRFNLCSNNLELLPPIIAHRVASVNEAAFHSVGPFDVRLHHRKNFLKLTPVKYASYKFSKSSCFSEVMFFIVVSRRIPSQHSESTTDGH